MNYFQNQNWEVALKKYPLAESVKSFSKEYHSVLCPDFPHFLEKYVQTPAMQRLSGIGLLCGTDWTKLYKNRFFYSRLEHSIGTALIVWNFTKNKTQTLASLFHDIATPCFSHVCEFRKGDALTQTDSESNTEKTIRNSKEIQNLLKEDSIKTKDVCNYHKYPIADNEIPGLSADRLEYMFPSGASLCGSWTIEQIKHVYSQIKVLKNEKQVEELGFASKQAALEYTKKFCETSHLLQLNENKLALQLLGEVCTKAVEQNLLCEEDFMKLSEKQVIYIFENAKNKDFQKLFKTFKNMTSVFHTEEPLPDCFCVNLKVKQRYINPLVEIQENEKPVRISEVSSEAKKIIQDFLEYKDTPFGCVKYD